MSDTTDIKDFMDIDDDEIDKILEQQAKIQAAQKAATKAAIKQATANAASGSTAKSLDMQVETCIPYGEKGPKTEVFVPWGQEGVGRLAVQCVKEDSSLDGETMERLRDAIINDANQMIRAYNASYGKSGKMGLFKTLNTEMAAELLMWQVRFVNIARVDPAMHDVNPRCSLGFWDWTTGLYCISEERIQKMISNVTSVGYKPVMEFIAGRVDTVYECGWKENEQNRINFKNGWLDVKHLDEGLHAYTNADIVINTLTCDYNSDALKEEPEIVNHITGKTYKYSEWISELADGKEYRKIAIFERMYAAMLPFKRWNKATYLYNRDGKSGKSGIVRQVEAVTGSIGFTGKLKDISKDFGLEPMIERGARNFYVDDSGKDDFSGDMSNFKTMITGGRMTVNRKGRMIIDYDFRGVTIACTNNIWKHSEKDNAIYRRQSYICFDHRYDDEEDDPDFYDQLDHEDVKEWLTAYLVEHFHGLEKYTVTADDDKCINEEIGQNNHVAEFMAMEYEYEGAPEFKAISYNELYAEYKVWYDETIGGGKCEGKKTFIQNLGDVLSTRGHRYEADATAGITVNRAYISKYLEQIKPETDTEGFGDRFGWTMIADLMNAKYSRDNLKGTLIAAVDDAYNNLKYYKNDPSGVADHWGNDFDTYVSCILSNYTGAKHQTGGIVLKAKEDGEER